ncbi:ribonuclease domain-containing protein [Deinococcus misasensis]|uniref:ribonuclease domain-containing protein n=1 Tax=Deinococcus misasensis TaxID=392413 RepID=UPI00055076F7|nr:ribonuclease domain-containing protein [Deinococcus misasensis]
MGLNKRWLLGVLLVLTSSVGCARDVPAVKLSQLPREVQNTYQLILKGGPFPYRKDGSVFQNREKRLPIQPANYYREYTVPTPGETDRGARRIVCGPKLDCFYTSDHYRSFRRILK